MLHNHISFFWVLLQRSSLSMKTPFSRGLKVSLSSLKVPPHELDLKFFLFSSAFWFICCLVFCFFRRSSPQGFFLFSSLSDTNLAVILDFYVFILSSVITEGHSHQVHSGIFSWFVYLLHYRKPRRWHWDSFCICSTSLYRKPEPLYMHICSICSFTSVLQRRDVSDRVILIETSELLLL